MANGPGGAPATVLGVPTDERLEMAIQAAAICRFADRFGVRRDHRRRDPGDGAILTIAGIGAATR